MKLAVVTDEATAAGYRLAGVAAFEAADPEQARNILADLVAKKEFALIAVDGSLLPEPYQVVKREMRGRDLPVLLSIASMPVSNAGRDEDAKDYIRRLIIETMGYEVKL